ncbi:MAG: hypothetical protein AB1Z23_00250 [Eubacteriales bacterium]
MDIIKNYNRSIFISLITALIISAVILTFCIYKYSDIKDQDIIDINTEVSSRVAFKNSSTKYHNKEIETMNYLAGYKYDDVYNDIHFLTSIESWGADRLKEVADELFANAHGDEMRYVEAVIIDDTGGYSYSATQDDSYVSYEIPISFYNFFPDNNVFYNTYEKSYITIYGIEDFTFVEDFAQPLSTAYGYHFVKYYMGLESTEEDKETDYYKLRAEGNDRIRFGVSSQEEFEDYKNNYMWYIIELAANDYMYLMGSDNAHRIKGLNKNEKKEREKYYEENDIEVGPKLNYYGRNIIPHINVVLDFPDAVDGLSEYFYGFIGKNAPIFNPTKIDVSKTNFRMHNDRNKWLIYEWEEPFGEDAIYRLIIYDEFDRMLNSFMANRQRVSNTPGYQLFYQNGDYNYAEAIGTSIIRARLSVAFPDGSVYLTDPIEMKSNIETEE